MCGPGRCLEVGAGKSCCGPRPTGLTILSPPLSPQAGMIPSTCCVQLRCRCPGGSGLGGVLLGLSQLGDCGGQSHEVRDERDGDQRGIASDLPGPGHQPGCSPQLVPLAGSTGNLAMLRTSSAV